MNAGFPARLQWLALWLSLLALASALLTPASVLAQEMRTGKWTGLCTAGLAASPGAAGHADTASGDGGHCALCSLPGLAWPVAGGAALFPAAVASAPPQPVARAAPALAPARPFIRGPPFML